MKKRFYLLCSALLYTFLIVYILLLLYFLFFARTGLSAAGLDFSFNLIPFNTIREQLSQLNTPFRYFAIQNIIINTLMLVPLGIYISLLIKQKTLIHSSLIFAVSLFIEIIQGIFRLGAVDIDDIILNCFGGFLGLLICRVLFVILKHEHRVRVFVAIGSSAVGGLLILFLARELYLFYFQ